MRFPPATLLVALCHTRQEALEVKARLADWLAPRGLAFNEDKTRVVTLSEGFDFLGFNVRRYGNKPLIKPSKAAVRRIRERLRTELRSLRGTNAQAVIKRLNPIIRGWAAYYRTQVSSEVFGALDTYLWRLTCKWARFSHQNKPKSWVIARYFGKFNRSRQDRWVFGDRKSGAYMHKFSWTRILRHRIVKHGASPDDPALADYWAWRRRKMPLPINKTTQELTDAQDGRCQICGGSCSPSKTGRRTRASGNGGWPPPAHDQHDRQRAASTRTGRTPSRTRRMPKRPRPGTAQRLRANRACLSPVLENCTPGS